MEYRDDLCYETFYDLTFFPTIHLVERTLLFLAAVAGHKAAAVDQHENVLIAAHILVEDLTASPWQIASPVHTVLVVQPAVVVRSTAGPLAESVALASAAA